MKAIYFLFVLFCIAPKDAYAINDHDIHLSVCELRFNESSSSFEVAIKIFIDDLETAIQKSGVKNLHIGTEHEDAYADEYIAAYIDRNLSIDIDGHRLKPDFLGKEITEDLLAVWCYVEYPKSRSPSSTCIMSNKILFDLYEDQRNIMDIKMSKSHKDYTIFDKSNFTWSYTY